MAGIVRGGWTLVELLAVATISLTLATMAFVHTARVSERAYWRRARTILLAVHAGEQAYYAINDRYSDPYDPGMANPRWFEIYMDDPNFGASVVDYTVEGVSGTGGASRFTARARRLTGPFSGAVMAIDQDQTFGGAWWNGGTPP